MKSIVAVMLFAFAFISASFAADSQWMVNYDTALKKAEKENKLILADFSGSDWCVFCIKLDKEVFSQKQFLDFAEKNFVLLLIDFPKKKNLDPVLEKQNKELSQKYKIEGFPTVLILDSKGKSLDKIEYRGGGTEAYIKMLQAFLDKTKKASPEMK